MASLLLIGTCSRNEIMDRVDKIRMITIKYSPIFLDFFFEEEMSQVDKLKSRKFRQVASDILPGDFVESLS